MDPGCGNCWTNPKVSWIHLSFCIYSTPNRLWQHFQFYIVEIRDICLVRLWWFVVGILEGFLEGHSAASIPESRRSVRGPQHFASLRVQEHVRGGHSSLWNEWGDIWGPFLCVLDTNPCPLVQICFHRATSWWQWRRCVSWLRACLCQFNYVDWWTVGASFSQVVLLLCILLYAGTRRLAFSPTSKLPMKLSPRIYSSHLPRQRTVQGWKRC